MTGQCLRRFTLANKLQARLTLAQRQVDALTSSLLARAFRGALVPQNPNDEPVEKLLERIKSHHEPKSNRDARK
jgi:type I restriction enzyme S subunit